MYTYFLETAVAEMAVAMTMAVGASVTSAMAVAMVAAAHSRFIVEKVTSLWRRPLVP